MKKTLLLSLVVLFILEGCRTLGYYDITLKEVLKQGNVLQLGDNKTIVNFKENNTCCFEDSCIKITFIPLSANIPFILENKSDQTMKIIWDETVYIDVNETCRKVTHAGVKYIDAERTQLPTIIAISSKIHDVIYPTDNIYYISYYISNIYFAEWKHAPLLPRAYTKYDLEEIKKGYIGKTIKILLPIQIQNAVSEYLFCFRINDFIPNNVNKKREEHKQVE